MPSGKYLSKSIWVVHLQFVVLQATSKLKLKIAFNYSTTETEIGLLNGEKLYRKIINGKINSNISQSFAHNISNIKTGLIIGGYLDGDDGFQYSLALDSHFVEAYIDTTNINIKKAGASNYQNNNIHFIIEYTKTTDTATN